LSGATDFAKAKAKTPGIKVFIPKLLCYHIHEKSMYIFTETITSFCVFLASFLEFSYSCFISFNHRYRRPRLLTRLKRRAEFENPRWRLNWSKIIERHREKPCFLHFTSSYLFLGRTNWCESFGCIFVLISTIYNLEFDRARMGKYEKGAKLLAWFLFLCIPSVLKVFYQFFSSNVIYIYIYNYIS
jgi:hypothetical protein